VSRPLELRLSIRNEWDRIDALRRSIAQLVDALGHGQDVADAISMTAAELLENAMKYGVHDATGGVPTIDFTLSGRSDRFTVTVANHTDNAPATVEHRQRLTERVADLAQRDPSEVYASLLAKVYEADAPADATSTGLGLARIAFEGSFTLQLDESVPGRLTITAVREMKP
jgi:hypothetical protein